jgi:hypothetical protein
VTDHSGEVALLLATLEAAEASVRTLAASSLDPGALMRVERRSTMAARARMAELAAERTLQLPTGWAEFVEVDESIDALLARAVVRDVPLEVAVREHTHLPEVPELAPAIRSEHPAEAVVGRAPIPARPVPPSPPQRDQAPPPQQRPPQRAAAPAPPPASDSRSYVRFEDPEGSRKEREAELARRRTEPAAETSYDEGYEKSYDDNGYSDQSYDDNGYGDQSYDDNGYSDQYAGDQYGDYYDDQSYQPEAPAEPAAPTDVFDNDWSYGQEDEAPDDGRYDPYAAVNVAGGDRLDMEDPVTPPVEDVRDPPSEMMENAYERTATELSSIEDYLDDEDDEHSDPTQVLERAPGASGPAAIQLTGDGGMVLGSAPSEDEEEEGSLIALGDAGDYGEELDEDEEGSMLGVGVVEYEEEEYDDYEEEEEELLPGAPVLTEDEVEALYQQALEIGRRDVSEGALLLGDVLDADPYHLQAHLQRGRLYLDLGDFARAFSDLVVAHDLAPTEPDVKVGLGDLYFARKDYTRAIGYFDDALHIMPRHAQALSRRGMSHYYKRNYADALRDLELAKSVDPSIPGVDTYISRARKKLG